MTSRQFDLDDAPGDTPPADVAPTRTLAVGRGDRPVRAVTHGPPVLTIDNVDVWFGSHQVLGNINLPFAERSVTALIGPSGCGKSTLLRCLNRMHELVPKARVRGTIRLRDNDIYSAGADPVAIRRAIGMVFQRPNPFPTKSIADNVLAGPTFTRTKLSASERQDLVEQALQDAGLWNEVKDRLRAPAGGLSGGQQQRLCIARSLAVDPDVLLMDEPCSALDPQSTYKIEDLIDQMKLKRTIVIVTHNMQQAARISDTTAFLTIDVEGQPGTLIEVDATRKIFSNPSDPRTEAYVSGRFG